MDLPKATAGSGGQQTTGSLLANFSPLSGSFFSATTTNNNNNIEQPNSTGRSLDNQLVSTQSSRSINHRPPIDAANYSHQAMSQARAGPPRGGNGRLAIPFGLLLASLCASVANTLLLSYVLKSVQISESGPINGMINWNKDTQTTNIELPVELKSGRLLALNGIDSLEQRQVNLLIDRRLLYQANNDSNNISKFKQAGDAHSFATDQTTSGDEFLATSSCCSSWPATNTSSMSERAGKLEVTTKLLQLWLLAASVNKNKNNNNNKTSARRLLIELRADQDSARLASGEYLERQASSLLINDRLLSPQIAGSLKNPLSLQALAGGLSARSRRELQVRARSGPIGLTASERLLLEAPRVRLEANGDGGGSGGGLYIKPDCVRYLEQDHLESGRLKSVQHDTADSGKLAPQVLREPLELEAYNLVVRGNLLLASDSP